MHFDTQDIIAAAWSEVMGGKGAPLPLHMVGKVKKHSLP